MIEGCEYHRRMRLLRSGAPRAVVRVGGVDVGIGSHASWRTPGTHATHPHLTWSPHPHSSLHHPLTLPFRRYRLLKWRRWSRWSTPPPPHMSEEDLRCSRNGLHWPKFEPQLDERPAANDNRQIMNDNTCTVKAKNNLMQL